MSLDLKLWAKQVRQVWLCSGVEAMLVVGQQCISHAERRCPTVAVRVCGWSWIDKDEVLWRKIRSHRTIGNLNKTNGPCIVFPKSSDAQG